MSTPTFLSGATCTIKIDGNDLKGYGIIINSTNFHNAPNPVAVEDRIPGRDGSFDSTAHIDSIDITLTGTISGNLASDLLTNIAAIKNLCRIKDDSELFTIEFQNVSSYVYKGRLQSMTINPLAEWYLASDAEISITIRCPDPYRIATTATSSSGSINIGKLVAITNAGNVNAPLTIEIKGKSTTNILYGVSETVTGWTPTDCTLLSYDGLHPFFPLIYGDHMLQLTKTTGSPFYCKRDILAKVNTAKYYCISVYLRFQTATTGDSARIVVHNDTAADVQGNDIASISYLGRSFAKISGADWVGAGVGELWIKGTCSGAGILLYDGVTMTEITATQYADATYTPDPYTEPDSAAPTYWPYIKVLGKNLCPFGKKDFDINNIVYGKASIVFDQDIGRNVMVAVGSTTYRQVRCKHFRVDAGNYKLSFQYKGITTGSVYAQILAVGDNTGSMIENGTFDGNEFDGTIQSIELTSISTTWQVSSTTVVIPAHIPFIAIQFYDNNGDPWDELRIAEVQLESGASKTTFEYYNEQSLDFEALLESTDLVVIDGEHKSVIQLDHSAVTVTNKVNLLTGNFLYLRPGTNTVQLYDKRHGILNPELFSGLYDYVLKYRPRYT